MAREFYRGAGHTIWLTGLPASGKSTLAEGIRQWYRQQRKPAVVLDGDVLRAGLSADLGFSVEDRLEQARRTTEVAVLLNTSGVVCIVALVSPLAAGRRSARMRHEGLPFTEVHVDCPVQECARRDPKGMYRRAMAGEIAHFTGISAPYEVPKSPEIRVATAQESVDDCLAAILDVVNRT